MKRRLKVYFVHSSKLDYKNLIYRFVITSSVCINHELMLPYTKEYQTKYVKEMMAEADIIIAEVSNPNLGLIYELKLLSKINKPIKYISLTNEIPDKLKKLVPEIEYITEDKSYIQIIENFIKQYSEMSKEEYEDPTIILGEL
ncbi:MAG: hypothetical protein PHH51_01475 [Bacilli bacterium]|nr:hypothetical protein [Bacilli bacterium]MDD3895655.1 hypothetical protein [Bacilli bacterium]MDD4407974.1 hypothetical protein [Bacilli bacterium]